MSHDPTARIVDIIAECQQIPVDAITLESRFDALKIDSLDAVGIIAEVENAFDIEVPHERMFAVRSVRDLVALVAAAVANAPAPTAAMTTAAVPPPVS